jgi:hypothetical protein
MKYFPFKLDLITIVEGNVEETRKFDVAWSSASRGWLLAPFGRLGHSIAQPESANLVPVNK